MALSQDRILFGIHSFTPRRISDKMPYGILKVIGSADIALSADQELLYAGSNKFPWASEAKTISTEIKAKVKSYPGFLFELFLGATVTDVGIDAAGVVSALTNGLGTSIFSATTGVASAIVIPVTGAANLKYGKYVLKATSTTAVKLYALEDINFNRGTSATFVDDTLEVTGPHTITTAGNTDIAAFGLRLTGGSGAIALVVGDTAFFEVVPPSTKSSTVIVGKSTTSLPNFGAVFLAQKRATNEVFEIEAFNVVAGGLPISLAELAFSQPEVKMTALYSSADDAVFKIRSALIA